MNKEFAKRQRRGNILEKHISFCMTDSMRWNLGVRAERYNLKLGPFVRALLEAVDDEKLYEKLLGPADHE